MNLRYLNVRRSILILLVSVIVLGLVWGAYKRNRFWDRQAAISTMEKDGAKFEEYVIYKNSPWKSDLGINSNTYVYEIKFMGNCNDATLTHLAEIDVPDIQFVELNKCQVTGEGLSRLKDLQNLQCININACRLGKAGLSHLLELPKLQYLHLDNIPLQESDFQIICRLTQLKVLGLYGMELSDNNLAQLGKLKGLSHLILNKTTLTDRSMEQMPYFPELTSLDIRYTPITDKGLKFLKKQKNLQSVTLEENEITKQGMRELQDALSGLSFYDSNGKIILDIDKNPGAGEDIVP